MIEDTICAPSTPPIVSPIAIIRISGPDSLRALSLIFNRPDLLKSRYAAYGSIMDGERIIDDVVSVYYKSPASYTGEDMAEIFCHGNPIIVNQVLKLLNRLDIRMAEPGEFTRRAFINGKMDLTEAEAINQIVRARSEWEIEAALHQMHGSLRSIIGSIRSDLITLRADIECSIDFADDPVEFVSRDQAMERLSHVRNNLQDILRRCSISEKLSHGLDIPLVGKPNAGKSSILNLILNSERAIVSDTPGTTRDVIRETVQFSGLMVNLYDTAGINETGCEIERKGIQMSHQKIETASIIIMVLDATTGLEQADEAVIKLIQKKPVIYLLNKIDAVEQDATVIRTRLGERVIAFSAKTGQGLEDLEKEIASILEKELIEFRNSFISDIRIITLLEKALSNVDTVSKLITEDSPPEITAFEIQNLLDLLAEITGEISPDDILDSVFTRFCIGK